MTDLFIDLIADLLTIIFGISAWIFELSIIALVFVLLAQPKDNLY